VGTRSSDVLKWSTDEANRGALLIVIGTLGGIFSYRRLIADPQKVRRSNRNGSIAVLVVIGWMLVGRALTERVASSRRASPAELVALKPRNPDPKTLLLPAARATVGVLMTELLVGKREIISPRRATLIALGLSALRVIRRDFKRRLLVKGRVQSIISSGG